LIWTWSSDALLNQQTSKSYFLTRQLWSRSGHESLIYYFLVQSTWNREQHKLPFHETLSNSYNETVTQTYDDTILKFYHAENRKGLVAWILMYARMSWLDDSVLMPYLRSLYTLILIQWITRSAVW
jgi:hypothetical protein